MPAVHCVVTPLPQNGSVVPTTLAALMIVLLAIVPGFVATTMWGRSRTWKGHDSDFRTMLLSVAISGVIHVVSAPLTILWIVPARGDLIRHSYRVAGWAALVVLVIPTVLGIGAARFSDWFQEPMLKATDLRSLGIFRRVWAVLIRGGVTPSILTKEWVLDENGNFVSEIPGSEGLMVGASEVRSLRILRGGEVNSASEETT